MKAIPPIKMGEPGGGSREYLVLDRVQAPRLNARQELDASVTIVARIRLARVTSTKLQKAIFGTRHVALQVESKKIASESPVLSVLLHGPGCWVVTAEPENTRLLQLFHGRCIRIVCRARALSQRAFRTCR